MKNILKTLNDIRNRKMKNILKTLNETITRTTPNCHPVKRAMLINRALYHLRNRTTVQHKVIRGALFAFVCSPSESMDYQNMIAYTRLSKSFAA